MISVKHRFVFVHIPKCAGTSVREALKPYATHYLFQKEYRKMKKSLFFRKRDYFKTIIEDPAFHKEYIKKITKSDFFVFVFTRNPYSRTVSLWKYLKPGLSFYDFLKWLQAESHKSYHDLAHVKSCYFYASLYKEMFSNIYVGKFENIDHDFKQICEIIGIPSIEIPWLNASQHKSYGQYFDDRTKLIVQALYFKDFEEFDYEV